MQNETQTPRKSTNSNMEEGKGPRINNNNTQYIELLIHRNTNMSSKGNITVENNN